jgi:mono/diheme cytochrome c family protein
MIRVLALAVAVSAGSVDEGRALFQFGAANPPVMMQLPGGDGFAPGGTMACAACHGADGGGTAEQVGIAPLARMAASAADPAGFARAVQQGIGADGHALRLMPRYALSAGQRAALAAYVTALDAGHAPEPGVSDTQVTLDIGGVSRAVQSEIGAYAARNPTDVYGRRLVFTASPVTPFARILPALPASPNADSIVTDMPPVLMIASEAPGAGQAAAIITAELLRRTGRRLTRPGFAATIDALPRQEITP